MIFRLISCAGATWALVSSTSFAQQLTLYLYTFVFCHRMVMRDADLTGEKRKWILKSVFLNLTAVINVTIKNS